MTLDRGGLSRERVPPAFDAGAAAYDRLVAVNPGYHAQLRLSARRLGGAGLRLLDAGCGTGASTAALLTAFPHARITAVDASAGMLAEARRKSWPATVTFVHSRIEDFGAGEDFDGIFAAYLLRNLADPDRQLTAFRTALRPGGRLALHEYSVRDSRRARVVWNLVCGTIVIPAGRLVTGDATLYRHLRRSVLAFDGLGTLAGRLDRAGFTDVRVHPMSGWQRGIAHTVTATAR
ncbi:class I SAM-dependent methyltransferase [Amycolatopsis sp. NPDC048633]|uniref:class I SAM-dependent methyltransferase n=1 Tax=Amycolatopsis sp. NPDC048633 TaxID=3157095 RepID=UPI0033E6CB3F